MSNPCGSPTWIFYDFDLDYLAEQGETDYMESFIKENFSVNFRKTP